MTLMVMGGDMVPPRPPFEHCQGFPANLAKLSSAAYDPRSPRDVRNRTRHWHLPPSSLPDRVIPHTCIPQPWQALILARLYLINFDQHPTIEIAVCL